MNIELDFFPNEWIPEFEKAVDRIDTAIISEIIKTSEKYSSILIEIESYSDLYYIGLYAGISHAETAVDSALPEVLQNMNNYINKITTPSTN